MKESHSGERVRVSCQQMQFFFGGGGNQNCLSFSSYFNSWMKRHNLVLHQISWKCENDGMKMTSGKKFFWREINKIDFFQTKLNRTMFIAVDVEYNNDNQFDLIQRVQNQVKEWAKAPNKDAAMRLQCKSYGWSSFVAINRKTIQKCCVGCPPSLKKFEWNDYWIFSWSLIQFWVRTENNAQIGSIWSPRKFAFVGFQMTTNAATRKRKQGKVFHWNQSLRDTVIHEFERKEANSNFPNGLSAKLARVCQNQNNFNTVGVASKALCATVRLTSNWNSNQIWICWCITTFSKTESKHSCAQSLLPHWEFKNSTFVSTKREISP